MFHLHSLVWNWDYILFPKAPSARRIALFALVILLVFCQGFWWGLWLFCAGAGWVSGRWASPIQPPCFHGQRSGQRQPQPGWAELMESQLQADVHPIWWRVTRGTFKLISNVTINILYNIKYIYNITIYISFWLQAQWSISLRPITVNFIYNYIEVYSYIYI